MAPGGRGTSGTALSLSLSLSLNLAPGFGLRCVGSEAPAVRNFLLAKDALPLFPTLYYTIRVLWTHSAQFLGETSIRRNGFFRSVRR